MVEEEKMINLNLQIENHQEDITFEKGFRLNLFEALYKIQQFIGLFKFLDILLTILEFIQLMAFPMDITFDDSWGNHWVKTISNYFRYFHLIFLWRNSSFAIITYILICIYIIIFLSLFLRVLVKSTTLVSNNIIIILAIMIQIEAILDIPFLRTLSSAFSCENDNLEISSKIKCKSGIHFFLIILSILIIIILKVMTFLFHNTLYEFGFFPNKLKSGYSSSSEILLDLIKLILTLLYEFVSHQMALAIITLLISIIILVNFLVIKPYSSEFTMKFYLLLYSLFCWSCVLCILSTFLKNSNFKSGIILLMLGFPFILIIIFILQLDYSMEKFYSFFSLKSRNGYNSLLEIEYFMKLVDSLAEKIKVKEFKFIFSYIIGYESKCHDNNCVLKRFVKIPLTVENFENLKILLLQHAELLYKEAISNNSNDIKLRIGYILFLFKRLNKKLKGKNEIIYLNKFEKNLESNFIIYKVKKYIHDNFEDKDENKEIDNKENLNKLISYKPLTKKIQSLIENIVKNYISFWNILFIHEVNKNDNFYELSQVGEEIKSLSIELNENIKELENWNLLDQETIKVYIEYLKDIINNNEDANLYTNQISEEELNKNQYDEINLFELNYKEMSKNEDYKYIIVNYTKNDFNKIDSISTSVCKLFGYTKEELLGHSLDILFPEIYNENRQLFLKNKIEECKQKLLIKNHKTNSEVWIEESFGKSKLKFLLKIKIKWILITFDDDKIFGIGNILSETKKIILDKDQELSYVLTDKNLIIQNFSPNAVKLLNLNESHSNISNYIIELHDNIISEIQLKLEKEESNINNKRNRNSRRKTKFLQSEILKKYNYLENNSIKVIHWQNYHHDENNIKNNNANNYINNIGNTAKSNEMSSFSLQSKKFKSSENLLQVDDKNNNHRLTAPKTNKQFNFTSIYQIDMNLSKLNEINKENISNNNHKPKEQLLYMQVKEAKFYEFRIGYIFIFRPYIQKGNLEKNANINDPKKDIRNSLQEHKNINISEISLMSFGEERKKYNDNQLSNELFNNSSQNNDTNFLNLCNEKESQFTFNITNMTYVQFKFINKKISLYDELKEKAIKKITNAQNEIQNKEYDDEEEESSESDYTNDDENSSSSLDLSKMKNDSTPKDRNKIINEEIKEKSINDENLNDLQKEASSKKIINENPKRMTLKSIEEVKKKEQDFYHVNFSKIELYIFNYNTGYAELQKGHNHKISHITYLMNIEKEKLKHSNSKFLSNAKFLKGKKKGAINKKEENEVNTFSMTSLKLKEIYSVLSSKGKDSSIIKMFIYSIIIFLLIIGTSILNILIYLYLKDNIHTFYILIEKSENLYQNLMLEITIVKEMLIAKSSYYNNTIINNKALYYQALSKMLYHYFSENTFIISNLTNNFNVLNKQDEESITSNEVELYILDKVRSEKLNYKYKNYSVLVYSAYRELNSAIYHISQLDMNDIYQYDDHVYYFIKNGMSNLLICSENQIWALTEKFHEKIEFGHLIIIICCCSIFIIYIVCSIIYFYFYRQVSIKKNNYLSLFNEIDIKLISSSLQKCEKFYQKIQEKNNSKQLKDGKKSNNSSSVNASENENYNGIFGIGKKNKNEEILKFNKEKKEKIKNVKLDGRFQIIIFLILFIWQIVIYIYYYNRMNIYENLITYEYYISMYASNFLYAFIGLREYAFDKKSKFYNKSIDNYVNETLMNYYTILSESSNMKDIYRVYFPDTYQNFLNYLYTSKICEFINNYVNSYPVNKNLNCNNFFYGSSQFGFFTLLTNFVEELRMIRDKIDIYLDFAKEKNFSYNESYLNDPNGYYEEYYKQYENNIDEYKKYNPVNVLNTEGHKNLLITYLYINVQVYDYLISESLKSFENVFKKYNSINLIINIIFIIIVVMGFVIIWIPFIIGENKALYKIKNMLSIIPSELLINLPDINALLGIE